MTPRQSSSTAVRWRLLALAFLLVFALRETGCDYTLSGSPSITSLAIMVTPQTDTIAPSAQVSLQAVVTHYLKDSSVTWSIQSGGVGQIVPNGWSAIYTAPATISISPTMVMVIVRSNEDTTQSAQCVIVIEGGTTGGKVTITLSPLSTKLNVGASQQFSAKVSGASDQTVNWKIISGVGTLSASGLFTAPATINNSPTTTVIQATANADASKFQQATIQIVTPGADTMVCFQTQILPMIISNCATAGCHTSGGRSPNLTTYGGIANNVRAGNANGSRLYSYITGQDDIMPPKGYTPLTSSQIALIARWINQGAQNTSCIDTTAGCDTTNIKYGTYVSGLMQNYCVGCHTGPSAGKGIDLTTWAGVRATALNGKLMGSIKHTTGFVAMPQSGAKLDDCTISKIGAWVNAGAQDN